MMNTFPAKGIGADRGECRPGPSPAPLLGTKLVTIETARAVLDVDEDKVNSLVEDGHLLWAWHIEAIKEAKIREVRIWAPCVEALHTGLPQPGKSIREVIAEILPERRLDSINVDDVKRLFCCGTQLPFRLVERGLVEGHRRPSCWAKRGQLWLSLSSLRRFLEVRRIL
jgi:hypothetical protein